MPLLRRKGLFESNKVVFLPAAAISPNPGQPRRHFSRSGLEELAASIAEHGVLQPLSVRRIPGGYELISGERRLRAARMAGLTEAPCIVVNVDSQGSSLLALVENLQRRDLDFIEEANGINQLIRMFGMSQEEAARRIGKSQSAVANKLRLLKLPQDVLDALRENGLSERHGRALLRLPEPEQQREALMYIVDNGLNVAAADAYIDALLSRPAEETEQEKPEGRRTFILKDVRVFLNTLSRSIDLMKQGGIDAGVRREETEDSLILTISIPKAKGQP